MNNVEFSDEKDLGSLGPDPFEGKGNGFLIQWLLSSGLAKNEKQANVWLTIILVGIVVAIAFVIF